MKIDVNDIVGKKFGKLTVLEFSHKKPNKTGTGFTYYYLCKCECGIEKLFDRGALRRTRGTTSCGCVNKTKRDIIGQKFHRLTVLELHHIVQRFNKLGHKKGSTEYYLCKCDCGNTIITDKSALTTGHTKSCGCLITEKAKNNFTKHNLSNSRLYNTWCHIKGRCYNPKDKAYPNYGGRGIKMCFEWETDFYSFYTWALQNDYKEDLTLDRIDVNGNYEPSNCRWVTLKKQQHNKRNNFYVTIYNRTQTLSEWCEEKGLSYSKIQARIAKGWTIEDAFTIE